VSSSRKLNQPLQSLKRSIVGRVYLEGNQSDGTGMNVREALSPFTGQHHHPALGRTLKQRVASKCKYAAEAEGVIEPDRPHIAGSRQSSGSVGCSTAFWNRFKCSP